MDKNEFTAIAIEDLRARQQALFELVRFMDQQAMALVGLYATICIAAITGFGASLGASPIVPAAAGYALLASVVPLLAGVGCCFRVLASADIALPGREPAFWQWVLDNPGVTNDVVLRGYTDDLKAPNSITIAVNRRGAYWFSWARRCGVAALVLAAATAVMFWILQP